MVKKDQNKLIEGVTYILPLIFSSLHLKVYQKTWLTEKQENIFHETLRRNFYYQIFFKLEDILVKTDTQVSI
jgi:hypothetical protein